MPTVELPSFFDAAPVPWVLGGFNTVAGGTIVLDPQREARAVIVGPTAEDGNPVIWKPFDLADLRRQVNAVVGG